MQLGMSLTLYGIRNCDTMKKARTFLDASAVPYHFHDYRKEGVPEQALRHWCRELGWEQILNRRGTTFRKLSPAARDGLNEEGAIRFMLQEPSAIRRPVLEGDGLLLVGFDATRYQQTLKAEGFNS